MSFRHFSSLLNKTMVSIFYNYRVPWSQTHPASRRWILTPTPQTLRTTWRVNTCTLLHQCYLKWNQYSCNRVLLSSISWEVQRQHPVWEWNLRSSTVFCEFLRVCGGIGLHCHSDIAGKILQGIEGVSSAMAK